jgi:pyridoxamine 5'-phosphate oxidase
MASLSSDQLAALRREYSTRGLRRVELAPEPISQFNQWLHVAHESGLLEPNAVVVATVDEAGQPWTRTVLLKVCDERGFTFFTNYDGAKAHQIAQESRVAMTFLWTALERQVNVTGRAVQTSRDESAQYWASRPRKSQLGAWASHQSQVLEDRAQLERQHAEVEARFGEDEVPLPPNWGGYTVEPDTVEFWQGAASRLHDRFRYLREANDWRIVRLSP